MANEQLISEIVSPKANEQLDTLTGKVRTAEAEMQKAILTAKQYNDTLAGAKTLSDINKATNATEKQQEQLAKLTASRQLAEERLASFRAQEQAKADARAAREEANLRKIEAANNRSAEAARRRAQIISESTASDLASSSSTGGTNTGTTVNATDIAAANAANAITAETGAIEDNTEAGQENARTRRQLAVAAEQERLNNIANTRSIRLEARERNAAQGSLEQRRAALIRLQGVFDNLNEAERASPFGQRLQRLLPQLNDQVLALERSTGRSQRNVGNYFQQAYRGLATIANILPGVGIAGLLAFATEPLMDYIQTLDIFKKSAREVIKETALQSTEYTKAVSDINKLKVSVQEFQTGTISKTELVNRYNESIGQTAGKLNKAQEVEAFYNSKAGDFVQAMLLRARANAALQKATEDATKAQERASSGPSFLDKAGSYLAFIPELLSARDGKEKDAIFKSIDQYAKKAQDQSVRVLNRDAENSFKIFQQLQIEADKYLKAKNLNFTKPDAKADDAARKAAAARIEMQINELKAAQDFYRQNLENQQFSLDGRLESLKNFSDVSLQIATLEGKKEKAAKKLTASEILAIDTETGNKQNKIKSDQSDKAVEITRQGLARMKSIIAEQAAKDLTDTERMRDIELASLTEALNNGQIGQIEYDEKRRKIENDYTQFYIELQIKQTQAYIDQAKLRGENTESEEAKLAAIKLKYLDLFSKKQKESNDDLAKEADELYQADVERAEGAKKIIMELFDLGKALGSATFTRRINEIEREKSALTERTAFEISNVEASTASEKEKADRIAIINARAASDQAVLDEKVKQQKIKQAKFDKAAAIAQIIVQTALAQIKVIGQSGLIGFTFSPLITALGAISLATALATPIPEYKHGKGKHNNYEGMAVVGDGGMSELIIDPNGRMSVTPNKPTLTHVSRDTQVISGPEFKKMLAKPNAVQSVGGVTVDMSELVYSNRRVEKAISKQSVNALIVTEKGNMAKSVRTDKYNSYVKKHFTRG